MTADFAAEENNFFEDGKPNDDVGARILTLGYDLGVIEAKRVLGSTRYDEIVDLGTADALFKTLKVVLARFAFYHAFPGLNLRSSKKGGFVRATGTVEDRNDIMSFREMKAYRNQVLRSARQLTRTLHASTSLQPFGTGPASEVVYTR